MSDKIPESVIVVVAGTILVLLLLTFLLAVLFIFQRRNLQHQNEKARLHTQYAQEILMSQIEVQNNTLQQIAQELHDNIGQLLSVAQINLNMIYDSQDLTEVAYYVRQTSEIVGDVISDVRSLTKSFDGDFVKDFGFEGGIIQELHRIEKTKKFSTEIIISGERYSLGYDRDILLFRIFQELLNNCLKHSRASEIKLHLSYQENCLQFSLNDNGIGFVEGVGQQSILDSGAGLRNVKRRNDLLNGHFLIQSVPGVGTEITINIPRMIK